MKHQGGCHCGQFTFQTELEPMLVVQCNCSNCRKMTGSMNFGCLYAITEIETSGETNSYEFTGCSGYINTAHFCTNVMFRSLCTPLNKSWKAWLGCLLALLEMPRAFLQRFKYGQVRNLTF
ncbi:MAG: hypothetical protein HOI92_08980 [Alphaproteobacteria bacterium]|nr:hypothetical protein [Alphaproteobacteria bacterium]